MSNKKYWQSFAELNDTEGFQKRQKDEFKEDLDIPFEDSEGKGWLDSKAPRRDFLKYVGFSTAAATLAASCEIPVRKAIPLANKPESVVPGVAKYYATTFVQDGEVIPVIAKVRDGRPIKIEGNDLSLLTKGGTSPRVQASVLDLYDTHRITHPKHRNRQLCSQLLLHDQTGKKEWPFCQIRLHWLAIIRCKKRHHIVHGDCPGIGSENQKLFA